MIEKLSFEDFYPRLMIHHRLRRTVTETDNLLSATMIMSVEPLIIDAEHAREVSPSGERLVNSVFTLGLMLGICGSDLTEDVSLAMPTLKDVSFPHVVRIGDTLHFETEVLETRDDRAAENVGSVIFQHRAFTQRDELVAIAKRVALIRKRSA